MQKSYLGWTPALTFAKTLQVKARMELLSQADHLHTLISEMWWCTLHFTREVVK